MYDIKKTKISKFEFSDSNSEAVTNFLIESLEKQNSNLCLAFVNPHSIVTAQKDRKFENALREFDLILPDGHGIILASHLTGQPLNERICGPDIFRNVLKKSKQNQKYLRFFFLGSSDFVLKKIVLRLSLEEPFIQVVGTYSPPFSDQSHWNNSDICKLIVDSKPDFLWVGLTAPKQEKWIAEHRELLKDIPVIAAIGAAFDFYAGTIQRSHPWFREHGLEWLPRLIREPKRLWRRNFISTPRFLSLIVKDYLKQKCKF
ncbi:MAG: WecB/TagA/CpsF family glycosyltransferase [Deltaproteobacteria bacterium]|nr:WecB/TagA/CpsF family glycosyltransferase [Deltaproteobacteria bacterium]